MDQSQIAEALKKALKSSPYTQEDLGKFIDVAQGTISKYVNGQAGIPSDVLEKLCSVLGLSIEIDGSEDPWELREAIVKVRELHGLTKDGVGKILIDAEVLIRAHRREEKLPIPKDGAALEAAKKEPEDAKKITSVEQPGS